MRRDGLVLIISIVIFLMQGLAQDLDGVQVRLDLKDGKTTYRMGEGIVLDMSFMAKQTGYAINSVTTEPPSPIDEISISPSDGVFVCGHGLLPDYVFFEELSPATPAHIMLPLNDLYRFEKPGRYSVHVKTHRVQFGNTTSRDSIQPSSANEIETNEVTFEVEEMSEADEQVIVDRLVNEIRTLAEKLMPTVFAVGTGYMKTLTADQKREIRQEMAHADELGNELSWLTGDPSTRAKVHIFLHPEVFGIFTGSAGKGFEIARNQRLLVTLLEQSMQDSAEAVNIARVTARLKAKLDGLTPEQTEQLERDYLRKIAKTIPERTNANLVETNTALFSQLAHTKQTETPEFAAAREFLITHFSEVSPWYVDGLLSAYGEYLNDPRIVPSIEAFLRERQAPILMLPGRRDGVFKQLELLAPEDVRSFAVAAVCDPAPSISFDVLTKLPVENLPEVDECLLTQIRQGGASEKVPFEFSEKTMLLARLATNAVYQPMLAVYKQYGSKWPEDAQGGMMAYLARYDEKGGLELLKQGIKIGAGQPMNASESLCRSFFSPPVKRFLEYELQREDDPEAVSWSAYLLSQYGPATDKAMIQARLDRCRKKSATRGEKFNPAQGRMEAELMEALIQGKSWQMDETEISMAKESCVSNECRDRAKSLGDLPQTAP